MKGKEKRRDTTEKDTIEKKKKDRNMSAENMTMKGVTGKQAHTETIEVTVVTILGTTECTTGHQVDGGIHLVEIHILEAEPGNLIQDFHHNPVSP